MAQGDIHFYYPKMFRKRWQELQLDEVDKQHLESDISIFFDSAPVNDGGRKFPGDIIRGTGGAYKYRFSSELSDKGQSGSYRIIYFVVAGLTVIFLEMYPKS
ncbi:MAG TPA: hypothetical protein DCW31_06330 [Lactobacillus sp.]|nr:hypothetical protein [Lactobacillus sp.]